MSIKDMLKVYPHDKLSHYQWASWLSTPVAIVILVAGIPVAGWPMHLVAAAAALMTIVASTAIGLVGEIMDKRENDAQEEQGNYPVHSVSEGDVIASAMGGLPAALPLAFVSALTWPI